MPKRSGKVSSRKTTLNIFIWLISTSMMIVNSYSQDLYQYPARQSSRLSRFKSYPTISDAPPSRHHLFVQDPQTNSLPALVKYEILDGWLQLGVEENILLKKLGEPERGEDTYWGALGTYVQEWQFMDQGITLQMESDSKSGTKKVRSIAIFSPCQMQTQQKIGIGSADKMVLERYSKLIDKDNTAEGQTIVVGSIYGGTIFTIQNGKVSKIFIGAAAE